ncbi:hypothetical protein EON64_11620, partial [archaeon]
MAGQALARAWLYSVMLAVLVLRNPHLAGALSLRAPYSVRPAACSPSAMDAARTSACWLMHSPSSPSGRSRLVMCAAPSRQAPLETQAASKGQSPFLLSSATLLKNCVGAGVFSLASRIPLGGDGGWMLVVGGMCLWAAHNFAILGEACRLTGAESFGELWSASVSPRSLWLAQGVVAIAPLLSCLTSTIVLIDTLQRMGRAMGVPRALVTSRPLLVSFLMSCVLYPLCSQPSFSSLRGVSFMGLGGQLISMLAMLARLLDGSYRPGMGRYATPLLATGGTAETSVMKGLGGLGCVLHPYLPLASLLSYCLVTHYNVSSLSLAYII